MIDTLRLPRRGNAHTHGRFFNSLLGAIGQTCDSALYSSDVVQLPSDHVYRRDPIQTLRSAKTSRVLPTAVSMRI